jgi:hypothetical protein
MTSRGFLPVLTILLVSVPALHASLPAGFGFPPAPPGVQVIDREMIRCSDDSMMLYAVLYSRDGHESMDVMSGSVTQDGTVWENLYTWHIRFDGEPVHVTPYALVEISECGGSVWFTFIDDFMQYEGRVCLFLTYDIPTGVFTEDWVD